MTTKAQNHHKRSREEVLQPARRKQKVRCITKAKASSKPTYKAVTPNQLSWKEVTLPDRFDDAEGFFGLEEIDNVEILRDTVKGTVQYRVATSDAPAVEKSTLDPDETSKKRVRVTASNDGGEAIQWDGFDDVEESENFVAGREDKSVQEPATKREIKVKDKKKEKQGGKGGLDIPKRVGARRPMDGNAFGVLDQPEDNDVDVSAWKSLGLSSDTLASLAKLRFARPTPIQSATIPDILNGHDVIGKASTGSGKTLAFGIPILEHFLSSRLLEGSIATANVNGERPPPAAMILSPTRELAHQLSAHLTDLCLNASVTGPRIVTLTGGLSLQKQRRLLANADIVIGTPGRLWETIKESEGLLSWLRKVKFLVIDEADRLLSEGHFKEVEEILNSLDREDEDVNEANEETLDDSTGKSQRQTLVFSATFQKELQQKLAGKSKFSGADMMGKQESMEYLLKKLNFREEKPRFIDVNPTSQMAQGLREGIVECAGLDKDLYLYALLLHYQKARVLIFTNSISSVRRLVPFLQNLNVPAHALHSQMPQKARLRSVERFSSPSHPGSILVATDVAARGLDIPSVQLILHYHVPRAADMYVHRSGRTARAEKSGSSILLCAPEEVVGVRRLVAKVHARNTNMDEEMSKKFFIHTIDLDRRIVARLKSRVNLSKKISDASLAKEKKGHEGNWLRTAADELGVDYDSEDFAAQDGSKKGRGQGRKKAEKEARGMTKGEAAALKAELNHLLAQRVNVGVSERYLSAGGVDIEDLLKEGSRGEFLGNVDSLNF